MRLLLFIALIGRFCFVNVTPDDPPPGEMGPAMQILHPSTNQPENTNDQTIKLHAGWNLVSWQIVPMTQPIAMQDILPDTSWFGEGENKLYTYEHDEEWYNYPEYSGSEGWVWDLNLAYYMNLQQSHYWDEFTDRPLINRAAFTIHPDSAWDDTCDVFRTNQYANGWFFMGYSAPGYCKLGTIFNDPTPPNGGPNYTEYVGPFHWLMWDSTQSWAHFSANEQYLIIVKDDQGRVYIPWDPNAQGITEGQEIDQIGTLEPGRGYFLGFRQNSTSMNFKGWGDYPGWPLESIPQDSKAPQYQTASGSHFQFTKYTQWSYPVVIDTVDLNQTPMVQGDEIGIFDGDRCVGAVNYEGEFPLVVNAWEDDIATEDTVDGYIQGDEMTFVWYDASDNTEAEFTPPPGIMGVEDDPVCPDHSGFGAGIYGRRSFVYGIQSVLQLPSEFVLNQNFPNPFNAETVIPLELPQRSHVKIELFNVRGQCVCLIFEGMQNAGYPKIRYNSVQLSSGMYFCRVTAEGLEREGKYTAVNKLVVLK